MTLQQLKYFQTLAYILHYTRASEALHIAQPSLSYAISELERELGVKLFAKEGRHISLTQDGKNFLPYVQKALDLIAEGVEKLDHSAEKEGNVVKLAYVYSISADFIPQLISKLHYSQQGSNITFNFAQELSQGVLEMIEKGEADLGFSMYTSPKVEAVPILSQHLFLVVGNKHPLAQAKRVSTQDFIKEPIIVLDRNSNLRSMVDRIYDQANAVPNIAFEVKECNAALQFVARGLGISILPLVPAIEAIPVKYIPIPELAYKRFVYLIWSKTANLHTAAKFVRKFIRNNYALNGDTHGEEGGI